METKTNVDITCEIVDKPMKCCGLIEGSGFEENVPTGETREGFGGRKYPVYRNPTVEDEEKRIGYLLQNAETFERSCALITLSEVQTLAIKAAEKLGFKRILEFFNPNSDNMVYLYAKHEWNSEDEYRDAKGFDEEDDDYPF